MNKLFIQNVLCFFKWCTESNVSSDFSGKQTNSKFFTTLLTDSCLISWVLTNGINSSLDETPEEENAVPNNWGQSALSITLLREVVLEWNSPLSMSL